MIPFKLDYKNPDYPRIWQWRADRLQALRQDSAMFEAVKLYYRENPWDFIEDWGVTFDPRNAEIGLPVLMPFIPFPAQMEWLKWAVELWRTRQSGLSDKSRDMGVTWCATSLLSTLALFHHGFVGGLGSRKEDLVDRTGDPDSLFFKVRMFLTYLPREFKGGWDENNYKHSSYMRCLIPQTGSVIRGEGGKNIGRGGRASIYVIDEAAHLEQAEAVETSLSFTTNCRIDVSSVHGMSNVFAEKRFSGRVAVKTMHWTEDPRKGQEWYDAQVRKHNPLVIAQEVDIDYNASVEGQLIPVAWINAAIDAHHKLGIEPTGAHMGALDVADEGIDKNAFAARYGILLTLLEEWSGVNSNIYKTTLRAMNFAAQEECSEFWFDSDGLGVGVRGDAQTINELRKGTTQPQIEAQPFRGSGAVEYPDSFISKRVTNKDFFKNRKAQAWWALRTRFENTYLAVVEKQMVDLDNIISIPSGLTLRLRLMSELAQVTYNLDTAGKVVIVKMPDGTKSPNLADACMILYANNRARRSIFG